MKSVLIVGGANGIGLSIAHVLAVRDDVETIHIVDRCAILQNNRHEKFISHIFDLESEDYSVFDDFQDIDTLMITAGFGTLNLFSNIDERHIISSFNVNAIAPIRVIKHFYNKVNSIEKFYCGVMVSIAGFMSSPFFSVYAATKAALKIFIESINVELEKEGIQNRILNVSPGSIKGTSFNNGQTNIEITRTLAEEIVYHLENSHDLFIPQYDEIFKNVLKRYNDNFREEGRRSYEYKIASQNQAIVDIYALRLVIEYCSYKI